MPPRSQSWDCSWCETRAISECWSITENENTGSPFILVPSSDPLVLTLHEFKSLTANKPQSSNALWKCRAVLLNSFQFSILQLFSLPLYSMNETNKNVVLLLVSSVIVEGSDGWDLHTVLVLPASQGFHPQFLCRNLFFFPGEGSNSFLHLGKLVTGKSVWSLSVAVKAGSLLHVAQSWTHLFRVLQISGTSGIIGIWVL